MSIAIVVDTEVNSLEHREVIELSYSVVHLQNGVFGYRPPITYRFKPDHPCDSGAVSIHKILTEDVQSCLHTRHVRSKLPNVGYWIGHNVDFDADAIGDNTVKRIDTLAMARQLWPNLRQHKLCTLYLDLHGMNRQTLAEIDGAHGAECDVKLCIALLIKAIDAMPERPMTFDDLFKFAQDCRIPKVMAFGKHKGSPIEEVPHDYVMWYARQESTCPYLLEAFRRVGHLV